MRQLRSSIDVQAPIEVLWELISRFEHWPRWGPTVNAVRSTSDSVSPAVSGSVRTPIGIWLPFVITDVERGQSWRWRVAGVGATGHRLEECPDGATRLEFSAPWYFFPYLIVLKLGLRRVKAIAESQTIR